MMLTAFYLAYQLAFYRHFREYLARIQHAGFFVWLTHLGFLLAEQPVEPFPLLAPGLLFHITYVINGFRDRIEDHVNGRDNAIPRGHLPIQYAWTALLLAEAARRNAGLAMILASLFLLTELYHHPWLRWKRLPLAQSACEALGATLCVLIGSGGEQIPAAIAIGLAFGLLSNLKDPDDVLGDAAAGHRTLFVLLAQRHGTDRVSRWFDRAYRIAIWIPSIALFVMALACHRPASLAIAMILFATNAYLLRRVRAVEAKLWLALLQLAGWTWGIQAWLH